MQTQRERASSQLAILNDSEENLFSANKDRLIVRPRITTKIIHQGDTQKGGKFTRISNISLINAEEQFHPSSTTNGATKRQPHLPSKIVITNKSQQSRFSSLMDQKSESRSERE